MESIRDICRVKKDIMIEILNKRERKLFNTIKNGKYTINGSEMVEYNSLIKKLKNSGLVYVSFADNCAFISDKKRIDQFEIEEKGVRKELRKLTKHDYKVAIISAIIGAVLGGLLTFIITYLTKQ